MREDKQGPMTLAINDSQMDLHVISFTGREALNQPYRFDVDLVSRHSGLDCSNLLRRDAYLAFGPQQQGIHGQIWEANQLHAGDCLSLYRVSLMPDLQRLATTSKARTFNGMSVPQIIKQLLGNHDIQTEAYRFERTTGLYPPREHCVQYQETDLHLLQRLCEEEGISFRFEHGLGGHVLVFADDPASFPEMMEALPMLLSRDGNESGIGIEHFAEQMSIHLSYSSHMYDNLPSVAAYQRYGVGGSALQTDELSGVPSLFGVRDGESARQRQISTRTLERLRCERRVVKGRSNDPTLLSGQIMRVTHHPERLLNDQWLLTEVRHEGMHLGVLKGCHSSDIAVIVKATLAMRALTFRPMEPYQTSTTGSERMSACQYRNEFAVIPWAMPFRPALDHRKPPITGTHTATLSCPQAFDASGRVKLRFAWQPPSIDEGGQDSWAKLCNAVEINDSTAQVSVRFFDDDTDQPVICGVLCQATAESAVAALRRSLPTGVDENHLLLVPGQRLEVNDLQALTLRTSLATLEMKPQGLTFSS